MNIQQAALTNTRVWARRYNIEIDLEKAAGALERNFPGSVLAGPLTLLLNCMLSKGKGQPMAAAIGGRAMAMVLRGEVQDVLTALRIAGSALDPERTAVGYGKELHALIARGLDARKAEKDKPSLGTLLMEHVRKGGVEWGS